MDIITPYSLREKIMLRIAREEKSVMRKKAFIFGFGTIASLAVMIREVYLLAHSGFYEYASLLFSGDASILSLWKELSLSLAETIPIFTVILFLAAIGAFVWSGAKIMTTRRQFA